MSIVDLNLVEVRKHLGEILVETFGIPPEILGHVENSNRATITAAQTLFACNVLLPRLTFLEVELNEELVPDFGRTDVVLLFDSPVPEDKDFALDTTKAHPWAFKADEIRGLAGMPALPDEEGQVFAVPFNLALVSSLTETEMLSRPKTRGQSGSLIPLQKPVSDPT